MITKIGNVLSLCDGISCLQIALNRAGIKYNNYYASEIDKHAIKCTQYNYPDTIQLGSMVNLELDKLPKIDLIAGGPPCQDFSIIGLHKGLKGERGNLTYVFIDIIKKLKPKYWLMENVASMNNAVKYKINKYIGCEPALINSSLVSAQNRKRYYWLSDYKNFCLPDNKYINLCDILVRGGYVDRNKSYCVRTSYRKSRNSIKEYYSRKDKQIIFLSNKKEKYRLMTPLEYERLQTLPDNYTKMLSKTQRYKAVGNAWTVDVIVHLLHCLFGNTEYLPITRF